MTQSEAGFALHPVLAADCALVGDLPLCCVLLMRDRNYPWLILVPRIEGATELTDLAPAQQAALTAEIDRACRALQAAVQPHKLNVAALGNVVPQLHVHVIARFRDDIAWPRPVWGTAAAQPYSPEALVERVERLRAALSA